jgi:hypothetical protein
MSVYRVTFTVSEEQISTGLIPSVVTLLDREWGNEFPFSMSKMKGFEQNGSGRKWRQ